jgi:hypothetical protein
MAFMALSLLIVTSITDGRGKLTSAMVKVGTAEVKVGMSVMVTAAREEINWSKEVGEE